ncbi:MAG: amino acid ABC transporter permease [Lachnospiraceae bacterium]|nr:amino acid ABC transporter permease [Lachnospiraceae bacterium]
MRLNTEFMKETFWLALEGVPITLKITIIALFISIILGFILALVEIHRVRVATPIITAYVSLIRGTPQVLQILIVYSLIPSLLNAIVQKMEINFSVWDIEPIVYAYIVFTINTTALLTETFRSALLSIDKLQMEAALSVGLTPFWANVRIIFPQAFEAALPNICTTTVNLIKGTSLAFMMSVKEVTAIAKTQASYGYNFIESYLDIFVIYLILCLLVQGIFAIIEKQAQAHRKIVRSV